MKIAVTSCLRVCLLFAFLYSATPVFAQQPSVSLRDHNLFSAGHAGAFVEGLYDAYYPYRLLHLRGNFGLGAPANLDGELVMLNGRFYQTKSTGVTTAMVDTGKTPYATVCYFRVDKVLKPAKPLTKEQLYRYIDSALSDQNGMYAIHIVGLFKSVRTRAFPPVYQKPYTPIAQMLDKQAFFSFENIQGDFVGFRLPDYMHGPCHKRLPFSFYFG